MKKKEFLLYKVVVTLAVATIGFTGCKNTEVRENIEQKTATIAPTMEKFDNSDSDGIQKDINSTSADMNTVSEYYLAMGAFSENIAVNGINRDETEVTVTDDKMCFPQGMLRGIAVANQARKCMEYKISKDEAKKFIDIIENAKIVEQNKDIKGRNIEAHMVYLNSHSEFRTINLVFYNDGYFSVDVKADDEENFAKDIKIKVQSGRNKKQLYLKSGKLEKLIKKWIGYREVDVKEFEQIESAVYENESINKSVELKEQQISELKKLTQNNKIIDGMPCDTNNYFVCTLSTNKKLHFSISSDGDCLSTDDHVYMLKTKKAAYAREFVKTLVAQH